MGAGSDSALQSAGSEKLLLPVDSLFESYPKLCVSERDEKKLRNGNPVFCAGEVGEYRVYSKDGSFLLLGKLEAGCLKTIKSFFEV